MEQPIALRSRQIRPFVYGVCKQQPKLKRHCPAYHNVVRMRIRLVVNLLELLDNNPQIGIVIGVVLETVRFSR